MVYMMNNVDAIWDAWWRC